MPPVFESWVVPGRSWIAAMAGAKEIPMPTRWAIATQALTRVVLELDQRSERAIPDAAFAALGDEIRSIANRYRMPRGNASDLVQTLGAISVVLFGPTFETPFIEGFPGEGVIRLTECAMFRTEREMKRDPAMVNRVCMAYVGSAIQALNPDYEIVTSRARCRGDSFCEMIIREKAKH